MVKAMAVEVPSPQEFCSILGLALAAGAQVGVTQGLSPDEASTVMSEIFVGFMRTSKQVEAGEKVTAYMNEMKGQ